MHVNINKWVSKMVHLRCFTKREQKCLGLVSKLKTPAPPILFSGGRLWWAWRKWKQHNAGLWPSVRKELAGKPHFLVWLSPDQTKSSCQHCTTPHLLRTQLGPKLKIGHDQRNHLLNQAEYSQPMAILPGAIFLVLGCSRSYISIQHVLHRYWLLLE